MLPSVRNAFIRAFSPEEGRSSSPTRPETMHGLTEGRSVRPAVTPGEGNSPTIKPYREYVPLSFGASAWMLFVSQIIIQSLDKDYINITVFIVFPVFSCLFILVVTYVHLQIKRAQDISQSWLFMMSSIASKIMFHSGSCSCILRLQRTHRTVVNVKTISKNMGDRIPVSPRLSQSLFLLKIFILSKDVAAKVKVGLGLWQIQGDR